MKRKKIVLLLILCIFILTGCTTYLQGKTNPETGQQIVRNIICRPTKESTLIEYQKYNEEVDEEKRVDLEKIPVCKDFNPLTNYEGLWTSIFVKPLAWIIIKIGLLVKNYGLALILTCLLIRLVLFPVTRKTAMQSELMKQAQPELNKLEKKYENKTSREEQNKKAQEMMLIYQKYI